MLGVWLKMPTKDLDDIEKRFSAAHGATRCKTALFTLWLQRNPNASWDQIAQALEKVEQIAMADRIRKCHPTPTSLPVDGAAAAAKSPEQQQPLELSESNISNYPLPPTLPAPQPSPQQDEPVKLVRLERDKVVEFRKLETSYAQLVFNLKTSLDDKQVPLVKLARYLIGLLMENNELLQASTIDELFHLISPHYCFLNTSIFGDIIERFIGEPLKHELEEYDHQLDEFKESTSMALLEELGPQFSAPSVEAPQVTIKLTRCYQPVTIKRFQILVQQIFKENTKALANVHVESGCISVTWLARRSAIPSLIAQAQDKTEFMLLVGVLRVSVAGIDILEQEEEEDTFLSSALVRAASVDSVDAVEMLLSLEADPSTSDSDGDTPLMIACDSGNIRIATLLLQARANINQLNNDGYTALMFACLSKTPLNDLVRLLMQYGADINIRDTKQQRTALMNAAQCGHTSIVQYLLEQGAPVNTQDVKGVTSLMMASDRCHPETLRVLLDYGADANMLAWYEKMYQTALMLACALQRTVCVDLLLDGAWADPNLCDSKTSPLKAACCTACEDQPMDPTILEKLLSAGANPNTQTGQYGSTALMAAASSGYDKGVQVLLNASADANIQSSHGSTALHWAAEKGHLGICKMLLASGARASLTNSNGSTPLGLAQSNGHHEVCELLRSIMDSTATQDKITKPVQDSSQPHKPSRLLSEKPRRGILPSITSIGRYFKDLLLPDRAIKHRHSNQEPTATND